MLAAAVGPIAHSYPKTIGPVTWNTFNPTSGGRRAYNGSFPQFTDTPGWTWPAGGPLAALTSAGYTLKMQEHCDRIEANSGQTHTYRCLIGGTYDGVQCVGTFGSSDILSGYITIPAARAGAVTFQDGCSTGGSNNFVGNVTLA